MTASNFEYERPGDWDVLIQQSPGNALERARSMRNDHEQQQADAGASATVASRQRDAVLAYAEGKSLIELGRAADAAEAMRRGVEILGAADGCDPEVRRAVLMTSMHVFAEVGSIDEALRHGATLEAECDGVTLGRVKLQQAVILQHAGRTNDSLSALDESDLLLAVDGEPIDRFRVHMNRGVVLLQRGDLGGAESDFLAAADIAASLQMTAAEGQCQANLGALYGRARRLVDALAAFDRAEELLDSAGRPGRVTTWMEIDRAEVMMHSGLLLDAVESSWRAHEIALSSENAMLVGDALLMCARAELGAGRFGRARETAGEAAAYLLETGRDDMVPHADSVLAVATLREVDPSDTPGAYEQSRIVIDTLRANGWQHDVDELMVERIRLAWRTNTFSAVAADLELLRSAASHEQRDRALTGCLADAVALRLDHRLSDAVDACRSGLDVLDEIVAEAHTLEARSAAMRLGEDLSRLAIETAVDIGDADLVFAAGEGTRARALHDELHDEYRHRPLTSDGARRLQREVTEQLGDRALVEWIVSRGRVIAVVVDGRGPRLVDVADEHDVRRACDGVMVSLDMATTDPDASSLRATRAAQALDELLVAPLDLGHSAGIVLVPVGVMHEMPWAGLPSLASRSVSLAPSAQVWLGADRRAAEAIDRHAMLSGPDVMGAVLDRESILHHYPGALIVEGDAATAEATRSLFSADGLVHVAAHGRFRSDRPLLSILSLHGGDATLYDAVPERVGARLIVLSSCEGGAQGTADGSEVLGLSAVMLARGAATVVAPLTAVRDLECAEFIAEVHAELASGVPVGRALATVRSRWLDDDDLSRWAVASSFLCFGSGATRVQVASGAA